MNIVRIRTAAPTRVIVAFAVLIGALAASISLSSTASAAVVGQVNFGPSNANVSGYQQDSGALYSAGRGYGWSASDGRTRQCFTRSDPNPLRNSICRADDYYSGGWIASPATWRYDISNGQYTVTVAVGDPGARQRHSVNVEGIQFFSEDRNDGKSMLTHTADVTVSDGTLSLSFTPNRKTAILWLRIESSAPPPTTVPPTTVPPTTVPPTTVPQTTAPPTTVPPPAPSGVSFPAGTHVVNSPIVLGSGDVLEGVGRDATILVPGPNLTGPMVRTTPISGDGAVGFTIRDLTIDCDNQCEGMSLYGARFVIRDVAVYDAEGWGLHTTWKGGSWTVTTDGRSKAMEAQIHNVLVTGSGTASRPPVFINGPHDTVITDLIVGNHLEPGGLRPMAVEVGPLAFGTVFERLHFWGEGHVNGLVVRAGVTGVVASNSYLEGANERQVWFQGANNSSQVSGRVQCFPISDGGHGTLNVGIQYDGATNSGHQVSTSLINCTGGGLVLNGGAGQISSFEFTVWNSPTPAAPAGSRLERAG